MSKPAPILFINRGNTPHLFLACAQARNTNPQREIIVLGNRETAHYERLLGVRHVNLEPYRESARRLDASFRNDSSNGRDFELFCLQRWFILHEFLIGQNSIDRCIHLDSDILVYDDLAEPEADMAHGGMTMQTCSGHSCFINSPQVLGDFVRFILDHYENPALYRELNLHTESVRKSIPGWNVSDMSFFLMFQRQYPDKMIELHFPMKDRYAFDQAIDSDYGGFEMENGWKKLVWQDGIPYCRHLPTGKLIRFYTLHFQGRSKKKMYRYANLKIWNYPAYWTNRIRILGGRARRKLRQ